MAEPVTFDRVELSHLLRELQGLLAELRYIDTGLEYLEGEQAGYLQRYAGGVVTPGTEYVEVEFGRTSPFTRVYLVRGDWFDSPFGIIDDTRSERIYARLGELAAAADPWAVTQVADVRELIHPYIWASVGSYDECIESLERMHMTLEDRVGVDFGLLKHTLGGWRGDAADNFASEFYYPFEHTLRSQKQLLTALMGGVTSAKLIVQSTQHSIMNVVSAAVAVVREQLELAQATAERQRAASRQETLIVASSVAAVFASILGPGAATSAASGLWGASLSTVSEAAQLATLGVPDGATDEVTVAGSSATALCESLLDAINKIAAHDYDQHDALQGEVEAVLRRVEMLRDGPEGGDGRLVPVRPELLHGVDGRDFYVP